MGLHQLRRRLANAPFFVSLLVLALQNGRLFLGSLHPNRAAMRPPNPAKLVQLFQVAANGGLAHLQQIVQLRHGDLAIFIDEVANLEMSY